MESDKGPLNNTTIHTFADGAKVIPEARHILRPLYEKILVRPMDATVSIGGIALPPPSPRSGIELRRGEVIAVGTGGERIDGVLETRPHLVKPGDIVTFAWAASVSIFVVNEQGRREELKFITVDGLYGVDAVAPSVEPVADAEERLS